MVSSSHLVEESSSLTVQSRQHSGSAPPASLEPLPVLPGSRQATDQRCDIRLISIRAETVRQIKDGVLHLGISVMSHKLIESRRPGIVINSIKPPHRIPKPCLLIARSKRSHGTPKVGGFCFASRLPPGCPADRPATPKAKRSHSHY